MNNQECKIKPQVVNINNNGPLFYPHNILINKCSGRCNSFNDPYAKLCLKNVNVKLFYLTSRTIEERDIKRHETSKCKCRLDATISDNKQRWTEGNCRCEYKGLTEKIR